jgi:hypothetical protein
VRLQAVVLTLSFLISTTLVLAQDISGAWTIPSCVTEKTPGRRVSTGLLRYIVPKHAIVKKFNDVDWGGYRVFVNKQGKWEVLSLVWEVNGSPYSLCSAEKPRALKLPNGRDGIDARCLSLSNGVEQKSRSAGVMSEYAYYRDISSESASRLDEIINSVCYEPPKK